MEYCIKCVQPNTRPGVSFESGLCGACKNITVHKEEKNWKQINSELNEIVQYAKNKNNGGYDAVVGVSGGKDSTFQALYAKEVLGLNVLLVNCVPEGITDAGQHNIENLIQQGFDCHHVRPNPKITYEVVKRAFYEYGNPVKPTEYPLYGAVFRMALAFNIPLIILGENPGITLGASQNIGSGGNALDVNLGNTLAGGNASDWVDDKLSLTDLIPYQFPKKQDLINAGIKAIYLGYYVKEFGPDHNIDFSISRGLKGIDVPEWLQKLIGRPQLYSSVDSELQMINKILKYYKMGFSDITTNVSRQIRESKMTREEAVEIAEKYDGYCEPKYIANFCDYLRISEAEFWRVVEKWTNRDLFEKNDEGKWVPKFKVGAGIK
jgi:N-acetyl sugar amidotransferase